MKKFYIAMLCMMSLTVTAQDNTWEKTAATSQNAQQNPDAKYLTGAVPEVGGRVIFETTIKAPGKSKKQVYDCILSYFKKIINEPNQVGQSRITEADSIGNSQIVANLQEWLVFKNKPLELDRTRLFYHLIADCNDGEATIKMTRIVYLYDEERDPQQLVAEEWITDRYGLNKKQTKLARVSGKFRRKTIDRKDYLFEMIKQELSK